jgi:hypothetical protein
MNNDKAKRKQEIFDFVNGVVEKHNPEECLSLASSLLITTIAALVGNDAAYGFSKDLNGLINVVLGGIGGNVTADVSHMEVKNRTWR